MLRKMCASATFLLGKGSDPMIRAIYRLLAFRNDVNAIKKGKVGRRIARRVYGKATGRLARRLFG